METIYSVGPDEPACTRRCANKTLFFAISSNVFSCISYFQKKYKLLTTDAGWGLNVIFYSAFEEMGAIILQYIRSCPVAVVPSQLTLDRMKQF